MALSVPLNAPSSSWSSVSLLARVTAISVCFFHCAWGPTPKRSRSAASRLARAAGASADSAFALDLASDPLPSMFDDLGHMAGIDDNSRPHRRRKRDALQV